MLHKIETTYPTLKTAPKETRYIYLLGAGDTNDTIVSSEVSSESLVRLREAIRLYQQLKGKAKIIVSGYSEPANEIPHAIMQNKLAQSLGVEKEDIIVTLTPRDTEEEALKAKELIGDKPFIIVTSAYHMKRAMKWFEKKGLYPVPAPTNYQIIKVSHEYTEVFSLRALMKSRIIFHEMFGMLWQKIKR